MTHTFALLELTRVAYDEIASKLRAAGYDHAFLEDGLIDLHGIGAAVSGEPHVLSRRVVCAAIRFSNGLIVCAPRHLDDTMHSILVALGVNAHRGEQGFVDQRGAFMKRAEALEVARAAGQVIRRCGGDGVALYSENLY